MKRESDEQYLRRKLAEGKQILQDKKDDHEAFHCALELAGIELEAADDAFMSGDCDEAWAGVEKALKDLHASLSEACELAPQFTTPASEEQLKAMCEKVTNLRIQAWEIHQALEKERVALREELGNPACPSMIYAGVARASEDMASERAVEFCLHECKYADRCDPSPKQEHIPVAP